jgi:hypothetical protein
VSSGDNETSATRQTVNAVHRHQTIRRKIHDTMEISKELSRTTFWQIFFSCEIECVYQQQQACWACSRSKVAFWPEISRDTGSPRLSAYLCGVTPEG